MKNTIKPLALLLIAGISKFAAAQDTAVVKIKNKKIVIVQKSKDSSGNEVDTVMLDLGSFGNDDKDEGCHRPARTPNIINSTYFNLGFANVQRNTPAGTPVGKDGLPELKNAKSLGIGFGENWGFNLIKGKLRLWSGIRYDVHNYQFSNSNVRLAANQNTFSYKFDSTNNSSKSKVVVNYIGVPIGLGYQSSDYDEDGGFHIQAGVIAGYLVRAHSKVKTSDHGKEKEFDDYNFNNFALTPYVQVGYNNISLYARMTTTDLFKKDQGPVANSFEFGLLIQ